MNKKRHTVVVGCVRNCGATLEKDVEILKRAFKNSTSLKFLIVESDSTDNTKIVLESIRKANREFKYVCLGDLRKTMKLRTERLAYCRNYYLDVLRSDAEYIDADIIAVADLDGINNIISERAVESCFERNDWNAVCANQKPFIYDIWALRHKYLCPVDCQQHLRFLSQITDSRASQISSAITSRMIKIKPDAEWIEVESAFGGLALYRKTALMSATYIGIAGESLEICEHVSLNQKISREMGGVFINPRFLNSSRRVHSKFAGFTGLNLLYAWSLFRGAFTWLSKSRRWCS